MEELDFDLHPTDPCVCMLREPSTGINVGQSVSDEILVILESSRGLSAVRGPLGGQWWGTTRSSVDVAPFWEDAVMRQCARLSFGKLDIFGRELEVKR